MLNVSFRNVLGFILALLYFYEVVVCESEEKVPQRLMKIDDLNKREM